MKGFIMTKAILTSCLIAAFASADTIKMVPFEKVEMNDELWKPGIRKLVEKTLLHAFKETEVGLNRLKMCAEYLEAGRKGLKPPPHPFNTSDLYKVMEGGAMMIQAEPNPEIEAQMDRIIDIIVLAQQDDGYLYVSHICGNPCSGLMFGGIHGDDEIKVYKELSQAVEEWIEIYEQDGVPLPDATAGKEYSGKFVLRVGKDLHKSLAIGAMRHGESLNEHCVSLLREESVRYGEK